MASLQCPHCGSRRVRKSERSRMAWWVAFVPLLSCFRCIGCGQKFLRLTSSTYERPTTALRGKE